jgi:gamma-glutamylcyclotransferase (GGCT)/AIG2-like uncharacterized protein YtfP
MGFTRSKCRKTSESISYYNRFHGLLNTYEFSYPNCYEFIFTRFQVGQNNRICSMNIQSLFVYGSLKRGFLREGAWPHSPIQVRSGRIHAKLFDLGSYPAVILSNLSDSPDADAPDDCVLGEVWKIAQEHLSETLQVLDQVEGFVLDRHDNEYLRKVVEVTLESGERMQAFVYEYANRDRLANCRQIVANATFGSSKCAAWPDSLARVPQSFEDE